MRAAAASRATGRRRATLFALAVACGAGIACTQAHAEKPVFRHPFDGQPIDVPEAKAKTPAIERFKQTGENLYRNDATAVGQGKALYDQWCQVCHAADGTGKMCPSLVGSDHVYPQTSNDAGMFAILYAGASGAMQSFASRMSQDEMLKVIAYVRTLAK
ncbi:MAG: c-type cytochrome [Burkholderiaceae bacterium]|nr:c-type cytochrome [Burkholderiaceae bacterium]